MYRGPSRESPFKYNYRVRTATIESMSLCMYMCMLVCIHYTINVSKKCTRDSFSRQRMSLYYRIRIPDERKSFTNCCIRSEIHNRRRHRQSEVSSDNCFGFACVLGSLRASLAYTCAWGSGPYFVRGAHMGAVFCTWESASAGSDD